MRLEGQDTWHNEVGGGGASIRFAREDIQLVLQSKQVEMRPGYEFLLGCACVCDHITPWVNIFSHMD